MRAPSKTRHRQRRRAQVLLVCLGVVGALVIAELGLRLAGVAYRLSRQPWPAAISLSQEASRYRVLCIGDSFTFGIGALAGFSYPEQLAGLLDGAAGEASVEVMNLGVPGDNSSQVLRRLEGLLPVVRPQVVVILVGTNNSWNTARASLPPPWRVARPTWLAGAQRLRIYRLFALAVAGFWRMPAARAETEAFSLPAYLELQLDAKAADARLEELASQPASPERHVAMGKVYLGRQRLDEAAASFHHALAANPEPEEAYEAYVGLALSRMFSGDVSGSGEVDTVLAAAIRSNPEHSAAYWVRGVAQLLRQEDRGAQEDFTTAVSLNPRMAWALMDLRERARAPQRMQRYLEEWLTRDLDAMLGAAERYHAKVVLLTYPMLDGTHGLSHVIRAVGAEHGATVIDLERQFQTLPEPLRNGLFASDRSHLNADGYRRVAEHVAQRLLPGDAHRTASGG